MTIRSEWSSRATPSPWYSPYARALRPPSEMTTATLRSSARCSRSGSSSSASRTISAKSSSSYGARSTDSISSGSGAAPRRARPARRPGGRPTGRSRPTAGRPGCWGHAARRLPHRAGDDDPLDLVRTLVDLRDLRVANHPLGGVLVAVAVAAEDLDRLERDEHRVVGGEQLGHRRVLREIGLVALGLRAGLVQQLARGGRARLHVGELELDALHLVDRLAERDPLAGIGGGVVRRALSDPDRLGGGAQARALERGERDRQALA